MFCHQVHRSHHLLRANQKCFPDPRGIRLTKALDAPGEGLWSKFMKRNDKNKEEEKLPQTREEQKEECKKDIIQRQEEEENMRINCNPCPCPASKPKPLVQPAETFRPISTDTLDSNLEFPKVVIVGAGIAGLSAAEYLCCRYSFNSITILEAKNRLGGRIHSCLMDKTPVEVGAQLVHGTSISNPIMPLVARDSESANNYRIYPKLADTVFLTEEGQVISSQVVIKAQKMFNEMIERAKSIYRQPTNDEFPSLKEFVDQFLDKEIPQYFKLLERSEAIKAINTLIVGLENEWGTELTNISAKFYGARVEVPGQTISFDKGFSNVVKQMVKRMKGCCVKLNKPVNTIRWDTNDVRAKVITCDGEEFPADYVIVTVSLGVLKTQANSLFCPPLPEDKLDVIDKMGFGHINKVFLQYEKPFWVNCMPQIRTIVTCDDSNWIESISLIDEAPVPESNVLVTTVGGHGAKQLECLNECTIAKHLTNLLRCATGDLTIPFPKVVLRSKWSSDAHFCGATSYISANSNVGDIMHLADPVPLSSPSGAPILFFAGEATSPYYFGTVHGARQSGIREAQRIAHLTKLFCGQPPLVQENVSLQ